MIKQSLKLVLIKHSVPKVDPSRSAAAWQLSLEGIERCHRLSTHLAESHPAILVSSHEPKAGATADHLAERLVLPVMSVDGLEEQHRMTVPFLTHNAFQEAIRALFAHPSALVFGEETADAACARFSTVIYQLLDEHRGRSLLVVTHGTVISLFLSRHTGLDPYSLWEQLGLPSFVLLDRQTMHVDKYVMQMSKIVEKGTRPQRSTSRLRSPALGSKRTTGSRSVGATFQLGAKFGVGRCEGIEKTSLISLTSEERRLGRTWREHSEVEVEAQAINLAVAFHGANIKERWAR